MARGINLLHEINSESENEKKLKHYATILSPVILIVFILIVIGVYSYNVAQNAKSKDLENKITITKQSIQSLSQTESYQKGIKVKLDTVNKIMSQQVDYARVIKQINEIQPSEIELVSLSLTNDRQVSVAYKAVNSDMLSDLINLLLDPKIGQKYFEDPVLKSLFYNKEGNYLVTLGFYIK